MRNAFIRNLTELARKDARIVLVTADMGFSVFEKFMEEFPDRAFNTGIAEQNSVGIASGLALCKKIPFVYSIAPFVTMRPFEQVRIDVCYQNLPVKLVGAGGGLTYGALGPTHHSIEDISLMRALPNMTVFCPGDPVEAELSMLEAHRIPGPAYIRLGKGGGDPIVHKTKPKFRLGKGIVLKKGKDVAIISTGNMLQTAVQASEELKKHGVDCGVVSMPVVKPIDKELIISMANEGHKILTLEEHSIIGGLGSAVAEVLAEGEAKARFARIALPDRFCSEVGSQEYLRDLYGLSVKKVVSKVIGFAGGGEPR